MTHYENQIEAQKAAWKEYEKVNKAHTIPSKDTLLTELLQVFKDTREMSNITFRGFLLGNYSEECLIEQFPNLYKYVTNFGGDA